MVLNVQRLVFFARSDETLDKHSVGNTAELIRVARHAPVHCGRCQGRMRTSELHLSIPSAEEQRMC